MRTCMNIMILLPHLQDLISILVLFINDYVTHQLTHKIHTSFHGILSITYILANIAVIVGEYLQQTLPLVPPTQPDLGVGVKFMLHLNVPSTVLYIKTLPAPGHPPGGYELVDIIILILYLFPPVSLDAELVVGGCHEHACVGTIWREKCLTI